MPLSPQTTPAKDQPAPQTAPVTQLRRPRDGFLFVVTYGRSGSTLTQKLLNAIPGYCIRGENGNALYHMCRLVDTLQREPNFQLRKDQLAGKGRPVPEMETPSDPWYGAELVDAEGTARRLFNLFCRDFLHMPEGTRVAGFKEIRYFNDLTFLPRQLEIMQTYFPKARILFLTRDHGQVANSSWWRGHDKEGLIEKLARADQAFRDYAGSHKSCFILDYSAFAGGLATLRPLYDFLGEVPDPARVAEILAEQLTHMKNA